VRIPPETNFGAQCSPIGPDQACEQCGEMASLWTRVTVNGKLLCLCCARGETPPRSQYAHPQCKLTDEDAYQIRSRWAKGADAKRLAGQFHVHVSAIYRILRGGAH